MTNPPGWDSVEGGTVQAQEARKKAIDDRLKEMADGLKDYELDKPKEGLSND